MSPLAQQLVLSKCEILKLIIRSEERLGFSQIRMFCCCEVCDKENLTLATVKDLARVNIV